MLTSNPILNDIIARVQSARAMVIFSHVNPDGDALGSALGLYWMLRGLGKEVAISFEDAAPYFLRFLPGVELVENRPWQGEDLILAVDGSSADRYGAEFTRTQAAGVTTVVIDHHKTNTLFGTVNWVDSIYVATAQMIYDLAVYAGWEIAPEAATCLATGCITDSNSFSTDHTTPAVLETVADLMRAGAPLPTIMRQQSMLTTTDALMWGAILGHLHVEEGVAWAISTLADRQRHQADENAGGGISGFLRDIIGVKVGILFTEIEPNVVRLSMRSNISVDVGTLALELGGGGHRQAAGATVNGPLDEVVPLVVGRAKTI